MLNEIARGPFPGSVNRAVCACTGHPKIHSPRLLGRVEQVKMIPSAHHSAFFFSPIYHPLDRQKHHWRCTHLVVYTADNLVFLHAPTQGSLEEA